MERSGEEIMGIIPFQAEYGNNPDFGITDFMDNEVSLDPCFLDLINSPPLMDSEIGTANEQLAVPTGHDHDQLFDFDEVPIINGFSGISPDLCSQVNEEEEEEEESSATMSTSKFLTKMKKKSDRSRTLISERKRRSRMKEKLYALRSLVPNITKMDKASIVGDAVLYVQDLQKQAKKLKSEIASANKRDKNSQRRNTHNSMKINATSLYPIIKKIYKIDVFQVEERGFYVRIVSNRGKGVAVFLYKALESLTSFNVRSSNLAAASENYVLTFNFLISESEVDKDLPSLKMWVAGVFLNQGFEFEILASA